MDLSDKKQDLCGAYVGSTGAVLRTAPECIKVFVYNFQSVNFFDCVAVTAIPFPIVQSVFDFVQPYFG